nr:DUF1553 domain-containing protein [Rhizobiaceae bacterium]
AMASENDSPMAAKGHIVASAFLGIELQCARCHDSPYHSTTQKDLYSLAAMLSRKSVTVPKTSQVPAAFFENQKVRKSLIEVTLEANQSVPTQWPFASVTGVTDDEKIDRLMKKPTDMRERLAALITAPQNVRFSRVVVNRIWKQLIGVGLVEPVHDWEGNAASHPDLLNWLAQELITSGYDFRYVVRLILTSKTYQRPAVGKNLTASAEMRFFNVPERRRLTAEQIVDTLHHATGRPFDVEELTFVHDGRRELGQRQTLGKPTRAWMFGDLKNERDRPSLALPKARAVVDVLEAFGWTGARQMPITNRETDPNALQPGVLANSTLSMSLTRASHQSVLAEHAIATQSPESLVDTLFLRTLSRFPKAEERNAFVSALSEGFDTRLVSTDRIAPIKTSSRSPNPSPDSGAGSMAIRTWPTPGVGPSAVKKELASKPKWLPVNAAARISTIKTRAAPLASPIGTIVPSRAALASVVALPSVSSAQPSGMALSFWAATITLPRATLERLRSINNEGLSLRGAANAIGFVPNSPVFPPQGAMA